jgi:hypothetical protein
MIQSLVGRFYASGRKFDVPLVLYLDEFSNIENADIENRKAVKKLALISKELNIKLIHISTDYVFDGKNFKPYCEEYLL